MAWSFIEKTGRGGWISLLINGCKASCIPATDRGLLYGDGVFETMAVVEGYPCLWQRHLDRMLQGCDRLLIPPPDPEQLHEEVLQEIARHGQQTGIIRITLTRGSGKRGYAAPPDSSTRRIVQWSNGTIPVAGSDIQSIAVRICSTRLGRNPLLAGLKHLNRLEQVMARSEWSDPAIHEGIMLDSGARVIECTSSNLFLVRQDQLITPDLKNCGVAGIMRGLVLEVASSLRLACSVTDITLDELNTADSLFVTNSLTGIRPVRELAERPFLSASIPSGLIDAVMQQGFSHVRD